MTATTDQQTATTPPVSEEEFVAWMEAHGHKLDLDDLLPHTLQINGKPMDVRNRRPMFANMFRKERRTRREIYLCGRQLGKSSQVAASIMMNMIWRQHFREMYVAPLALYAQKMHHDYMAPMMQTHTFPWPIQDKDCVSNQNQKTFVTRSRYLGVSCFNSPRAALGSAIDSLRFDECQDINYDFVPQILETMRTSDYRYETYTGTARGIENTIQILFDQSSGGEWHMKCDCGRWVVPTREKDAISMIQKHGIACPKCKRPLDVTKGEWVHAFPDRLDPVKCAEAGTTPFAGFHIPATIVLDAITPIDRYISTIYDKLHGLSKYSEAKFFQEILGISTDQGGRPITAAEIKERSILQMNFGKQDLSIDEVRKHFQPGAYQSIAGGADWGGSEITSFTVGALVGWHTETNRFHCLGGIRPTGIPDNERHFPLAAFFRRPITSGGGRMFGIGADAGFVGSVQNKNLQRVSGIKTLSIAYGTKKSFYQMYPANLAIVDRTTLIWIAYQLLKDGLLLLPAGIEFESLSADLLATFIEDVEAPNGITIRRYCRYKQKADDFLHALGYAVFVCALGVRTASGALDLPQLIGMNPGSSANHQYLHLIGEEGSDKSFGLNQFSM